MFDHTPQAVDQSRKSNSTRSITVSVRFIACSCKIKYCITLQTKHNTFYKTCVAVSEITMLVWPFTCEYKYLMKRNWKQSYRGGLFVCLFVCSVTRFSTGDSLHSGLVATVWGSFASTYPILFLWHCPLSMWIVRSIPHLRQWKLWDWLVYHHPCDPQLATLTFLFAPVGFIRKFSLLEEHHESI